MDERTEAALDTTLEQELLRNERIIDHPIYGKVRLSRPTPEQEGFIADIRRRRMHSDMFDDVDPKRSRDELLDRAVLKGMWRPEFEEQMERMMERLGEGMGILSALGYQSPDALVADYQRSVKDLLAFFPDDQENAKEVRDAIRAYTDLDGTPDKAHHDLILANAPSTQVDDALLVAESLRMQLNLLQEVGQTRKELGVLQTKQARILADSIEARADREEELARLFYCATKADTGERLWPSFEALKQTKPETLAPLLLKMGYFVHGVTPEWEEMLGRFGFTQRLPDTSASSAESHGQPASNSDGSSADSEPISSSPATE